MRLLYLLPILIYRLTGWLPFQPKPGKVTFANAIPLEECAKTLGVVPDAKLQQLVDQMHVFAKIVVEDYCEHRKEPRPSGGSGGFAKAATLIPEQDLYEIEERAAILEYDGGHHRDVAERKAIIQHTHHRAKGNGKEIQP
jgi:hypothetical protein